jgi:hypothetical protein
MIAVIPWYITLIVIATNTAIAIAVWSILSLAAGRSSIPAAARRGVRIGSAVFLGAWLGAVMLLAPAPASLLAHGPFYITPLIPLFFGASIAIVLLALWRSSTFRRALAAVPLPVLNAVQVYRTIGVVFVILFAQGQLPAHFALPAGWGDIAVGLTAPLVALALARGIPGAHTLAIWWNALGLVDLAVAIGMGTGLLAPLFAPELGTRVPPAGAMGTFPMILVPTFAVPVSVLLHSLALGRLSREVRFGSRLAPTAAR